MENERKKIPTYRDLPRWVYDPAFDTHKDTSLDGATDVGREELLHESDNKDVEDADLSDDEKTPYSWPSDINRYKALASSAELSPPKETDSAVELTVDPAIRLVSKQPRAIVRGQHRLSTLRVLVRLMRDVHSDVFDGTTELGENGLWRTGFGWTTRGRCIRRKHSRQNLVGCWIISESEHYRVKPSASRMRFANPGWMRDRF